MPTRRTGSACAAENENAAAPAIEASSRRVIVSNLVRGEAVDQAVAARALGVGLAAAAARSARGMRRVPRLRGRALVEPGAVRVTDHRGAGAVLGPVAAGAVVRAGERRAVRLRAGEDVMTVRRVAAAVDDLALLAQRGLLGEIVGGAMQVGDVLRDHGSLGVLPRAAPDAVLGVDGVRALRRQICAPGLAGRAGRGCERRAMPVGAIEPAEIAAANPP